MGGDGCKMSRFFVEKGAQIGEMLVIKGENFHHIKNVLRHKIEDRLVFCDGSGLELFCVIKRIYKDCLEVFVEDARKSKNEPDLKITLFQGLPKADKFEYIIQKAVELGVNDIVPVKTSRCIVKIDENSARKKIDRWQKISFEAAKQSRRAIIPKIKNIVSFNEACKKHQDFDLRIIPFENEKINTIRQTLKAKNLIKNIGVFIGPEGGFEESEIDIAKQNSIIPVTLGNRILRTETAGIAILSMLMYEFEEA